MNVAVTLGAGNAIETLSRKVAACVRKNSVDHHRAVQVSLNIVLKPLFNPGNASLNVRG